MTMRERIINRIKDSGWLDYSYDRGDPPSNANPDDMDVAIARFGIDNYEEWLQACDDEEVLAAYDRVQERESNMD